MSDQRNELRRIEEIQAILDTPTPDDATNSLRRPPVSQDGLRAALDEFSAKFSGESWRFRPLDNSTPEDDPVPTVLSVRNSFPLLYAGDLNSLIGEPNLGKSWIALHAAAEVLINGGRVLWIDYEEPRPTKLRSRLVALGVPVEVWPSMSWISPREPLTDRRNSTRLGGYALVREQLSNSAEPYQLVVIDAMAGLMAAEGLDENATDEVEYAYSILRDLFIATTGAAGLVLDHVTKSKEGRGRWAIGNQRKISGISGAGYYLEATAPWKRATLDPVRGSARLIVTKDRNGHRAIGDTAATVEVVAYPDGQLDLRLTNPRDTVEVPSNQDIRKVVEEIRFRGGQVTESAIRDEVGIGKERVRLVVRYLGGQGALTLSPRNGGGTWITLNEPQLRTLDLD